MRLADRRGLLQGSTNQVQGYALRMLMVHEGIEANERYQREQVETFRQRIAAAHMEKFDELYPPTPEMLADQAFQQAVRPDGTIDPDKVNLNEVPEAPAPQSEREREQLKKWIEEIGAGTINGSITGADLNSDTWTEWQ